MVDFSFIVNDNKKVTQNFSSVLKAVQVDVQKFKRALEHGISNGWDWNYL